jgi:hypothetical protein
MNRRFGKRPVSLLAVSLLAAAIVIASAPQGFGESSSKDVTVTNTPLPVADAGGSLTVDGNVGIAGTPNVNVTNSSLPVGQSGAWNVGIEGAPTVRPGVPSQPFWEAAHLTTANSLRVVGGTTSFIGLSGITATNFDHSTVAQVDVRNGITTGPGCSGSATGGSVPDYTILVGPRATVHLDFPTPAVFRAVSPAGAEPATDTCIRLELNSVMTGSVDVFVNGLAG